ncbi:MAG: hypothetical protein ABIW81_00335 [Terrimesophilobacter sp.]
MKTGTRVALIALAGAVIILLSGCVRFPADVTPSSRGMLNDSSVSASLLSHPMSTRTPDHELTRAVWTTGSAEGEDVHAVTSNAPLGPPVWVWVVVEVGVLVALGVLVAILIYSFRDSSDPNDDAVDDLEIN